MADGENPHFSQKRREVGHPAPDVGGFPRIKKQLRRNRQFDPCESVVDPWLEDFFRARARHLRGSGIG